MSGSMTHDSMEDYQNAIYTAMEAYGRKAHGPERDKLRKKLTESMKDYNRLANHNVFEVHTWWMAYNSKTIKK